MLSIKQERNYLIINHIKFEIFQINLFTQKSKVCHYSVFNSIVVYNVDNDFPLVEKNTLIKTLPRLSQTWTLSVDVKPIGVRDDWSNIVHATIGGNIEQYGDRIPGIWFQPLSFKPSISSAVNGNANYIYNHPTNLPMNEITNIKVKQTYEKGYYVYRIYIGGTKVHEVVNNEPQVFQNVKLYASDPWYNPAIAEIDDLQYESDFALLEKNVVIETLPCLSKSWALSVDVKPIGNINDWSNIVHATIGGNIEHYGDRIPGIWFLPGSTKPSISSAVNGNANYMYNHPTDLPMNKFTNLKVEQTLEGGKYFYRIYIDGMKVHEVVNEQPQVFKNVVLYAGDPWYNPAIASIDALKFGDVVGDEGSGGGEGGGCDDY